MSCAHTSEALYPAQKRLPVMAPALVPITPATSTPACKQQGLQCGLAAACQQEKGRTESQPPLLTSSTAFKKPE